MTINYPIKKKTNINVTHSNRGKSLEDDINLSNKYYQTNNIAVVYKKPTPVQIVKVEYPKRSAAVIKEAYFRTPSTTDYNGCYRGKYIDFEAKETLNKSLFPLQNIHKHQIEHIKNIIKNKGIAFLIIRFSKLNKAFLLKGEDLLVFWDEYILLKRKSIKITEFEELGFIIEEQYNPRMDYIKTIEKVYFIDK